MPNSTIEQSRPQSPNIQIYRPQLTSVLSIANRISGVASSIAAVGLVVWLLAAAAGPETYAVVRGVLASPFGQIVLFGVTFGFLLHLCSSIRHLAWDAGYGFELSAIYASGWAAVGASVVLTAAVWIAALFMAR
jgi:succinate dehydrogenase / fumarate reductase cytochrome b subunit